MANTFVKIQTVTVGSGGAANIEFTSIPQTFTDLKLFLSARDAYAGNFDSYKLNFNNNSSNSYVYRYLEGTGSAVSSGKYDSPGFTSGFILTGNAANSTSSVFANIELYIPNYTSSNYKSWSQDGVQENNITQGYQYLVGGVWTNTAAITTITITPYQPVDLVQYSTATLYGIKSS